MTILIVDPGSSSVLANSSFYYDGGNWVDRYSLPRQLPNGDEPSTDVHISDTEVRVEFDWNLYQYSLASDRTVFASLPYALTSADVREVHLITGQNLSSSDHSTWLITKDILMVEWRSTSSGAITQYQLVSIEVNTPLSELAFYSQIGTAMLASDDTIYGSASADTISAFGGNDVILGKGGADTMIGGQGHDTYYVENIGDVVTENVGEGTDTVWSSLSSYTLASNVENLILNGDAAINGTGNSLANTITGNSGNNTLNGGNGNDTLNAAGGTNTLDGGSGNDTYVVDLTTFAGRETNIYNTINDLSGTGDTLQVSFNNVASFDSDFYINVRRSGTLGQDFDVGIRDGKNQINSGLDAWFSKTTVTNQFTLDGSGQYYPVNVENLTLLSTSINNGQQFSVNMTLGAGSTQTHLIGTSGSDLLMGFGGDSTIDGGDGSDHIMGSRLDTTSELAIYNTRHSLTGSNAITVNNAYTKSISGLIAGDVLNGGSGDDYIESYVGNDTQNGGSGNDDLLGGSGNDVLNGGDGSDTLNGQKGQNTLDGGNESDTYVVDLTAFAGRETNVYNSIHDTGVSGNDEVHVTFNSPENFNSAYYANIRRAGITGQDLQIGIRDGQSSITNGLDGWFSKNTITDQYIWTGSSYVANLEKLVFVSPDIASGQALTVNLTVGAGSTQTSLLGTTADDYLMAYGGDTSVTGGDGNDFVVGSRLDTNDELAIYNTRHSLTGSNAVTVTNVYSRSIAGLISAEVLIGGAGNDYIESYYGSDTLNGGTGDDYLKGGNGNNTLIGGSGNDAMDGDDGVDTAVFNINSSAVTSFARSAGGNGYVISSSEGVDSLIHVESVQFNDVTYSMAQALKYLTAKAVTYAIPVASIQSIGLSADGLYLIIKVGGETKVIGRGDSLGFSDDTLTTEELTTHVAPIPVFKSSGGTGGYALPDLYTGPASLGLKYQLIESAKNAVVTGSSDNDFIKVSSEDSLGKAVNGGGGNDVIDGGVGSTFVTGGDNHNDTFFLDGRAPGVSWSTITDFRTSIDKATIWGFVKGVSSVDTSFANFNSEGAGGYQGLTLHFKNLLPDGQTSGSNANLNSITLTGHTLAEFGAGSLAELNAQINAGTNAHFIVGATNDSLGTHSYLQIV